MISVVWLLAWQVNRGIFAENLINVSGHFFAVLQFANWSN